VPSPVGHALGALAVGWLAGGTPPDGARRRQSLCLVGLALAPDLDLLIGRHSMETHSLGAACLAGGLAVLLRWPLAQGRTRTFLTAAVVWMTHPLLDALGADTSPPFGVMMFWPVSTAHVTFSPLFGPISRRWWLDGFIATNVTSVARELLLLAPVAAVAWLARAWGTRGHGGRPDQA
jgi:inner membrane protein